MNKYFKKTDKDYVETNENKPVSRKNFPKEVAKGDYIEREEDGKKVVKQVINKIEFENGAIVLEVTGVENYGA